MRVRYLPIKSLGHTNTSISLMMSNMAFFWKIAVSVNSIIFRSSSTLRFNYGETPEEAYGATFVGNSLHFANTTIKHAIESKKIHLQTRYFLRVTQFLILTSLTAAFSDKAEETGGKRGGKDTLESTEGDGSGFVEHLFYSHLVRKSEERST